MLQWLLDACGCSMDAVTFVSGYQSDVIRARYPKLKVLENTDWEHTGSGASILVAPLATDTPLLVSYSDIMFRASVPVVSSQEADVTLTDSAWEYRYSGRGADLTGREKVVVNGERIETRRRSTG